MHFKNRERARCIWACQRSREMNNIQKLTLAILLFLSWGPNPLLAGQVADADIDKRAEAILKQMTLKNKIEYLGCGPFLSCRLAVNYIEGVQSQGVCATVKHFMGNNSEFGRHHTSSDM